MFQNFISKQFIILTYVTWVSTDINYRQYELMIYKNEIISAYFICVDQIEKQLKDL